MDLHRLPAIFRNYPDIQAVYLFGSVAAGNSRHGSDIDLAIVPVASGLQSKKIDILTELVRQGFAAVDLVVLENTDSVLAYEAVRQNHLVYQVPHFDRGSLYSSIVRQYFDMLPSFQVQRSAYKRRMLNDTQNQESLAVHFANIRGDEGVSRMVHEEVLYRRLQKLDEYLVILYDLQRYTFDDFVAHYERYGSAERFLHLAIESLSDMGNHVIADMNLGIVNWSSDVPRILAQAGYIDQAMQETWVRMIGFRNILVHQYTDIDHRQVYEILQQHVADFETLKRVFVRLL